MTRDAAPDLVYGCRHKMNDVDWLSPRGAREFTELALDAARAVFERDGAIALPLGMFIARVDPETGEAFATPKLVPWGLQGTAGGEFASAEKDALASWIRQMVKDSNAAAFCFTTEAWAAKMEPHEKAEDWGGRLSEHPNRIEQLFVSVEHVAIGPFSYAAEIVRDHAGRPHLCAWVKIPAEGSSGRFGACLPPDAPSPTAS